MISFFSYRVMNEEENPVNGNGNVWDPEKERETTPEALHLLQIPVDNGMPSGSKDSSYTVSSMSGIY